MWLITMPVAAGAFLTLAAGMERDVRPCPLGAEADIWVCAGQSNMAGGGILTGRTRAVQGALVFNMDNTWIPAQDPVHRIFAATAPAFRDFLIAGWGEAGYRAAVEQESKTPFGGVGPALTFGEHIVKGSGRKVGLVPCALGATSMAQWSPDLKSKGTGSLYGNMLDRIAMVGGKVKGLLWYQGEGETGPGLQEPFERTWLDFVDSLRRDTGLPDLPIIYAQISRYAIDVGGNYGEAWERIRETQRTAAGKRHNLYVVSTIDLPLDDLIHIGSDGQKRLGKRMAEVALSEVYGLRGRATPIDFESAEVQPPMDELHNSLRVRFRGVTGKLQAKGRPSGFSLRTDTPGSDGPMVYRVDFDPRDPSAVIVRYSKPIKTPVSLYYGAGLDPYANIVDSKDMAVPAFGPVLVSPRE